MIEDNVDWQAVADAHGVRYRRVKGRWAPGVSNVHVLELFAPGRVMIVSFSAGDATISLDRVEKRLKQGEKLLKEGAGMPLPVYRAVFRKADV